MRLSFTPAERRALYFLVTLVIVAIAVQIHQRYTPGASRHYTIEVDTTQSPAPARNRAAEDKLKRGIDPNTAPQEDLELLPGIGPALARAIIAEREEHGAFVSAADLERVPGIGKAKVKGMNDYLRFP